MSSISRALFLAIFGISCVEAAVVTNVACAAYGYSPSGGSTQCSQGGGSPYGFSPSAAASVTTSVTLPSTASNYVVSSINESTYATAGVVIGLSNFGFGVSDASATASVHLDLFSSGAARNGLLDVYFPALYWSSSADGFLGSLQLSLGSLEAGCTVFNANSANACTGFGHGALLQNAHLFLPFELGTAFLFDETQTFSAVGDLFDGRGSGFGQTSLAFRLLEIDGVTPVSIYSSGAPAVPEPASLLLVSAPLGGLCLLRRLRWS